MADTSLEQLFAVYSDVASELLAAAPDAPDRPRLQEDADRSWLEYIDAHGGREPWHEVGQPWEYKDDFTPMKHGSSDGPIDELRKLLGIHTTGALGELDDYAIYLFRQQHFLITDTDRKYLSQLKHPPPQTVDRHLWSLILSEKGELLQSEAVLHFAVPTNTGKMTPLVIRKKRHWKLALDLCEERTFVNQHNLALLATISYAKLDEELSLEEAFRDFAEPRFREDVVFPPYLAGSPHRPIVRPDQSGNAYEYGSLDKKRTHTQAFLLDHPEHTVIACRGTQLETDPSKLDRPALEALIADLSTDLDSKRARWKYDGSIDESGNPRGLLGLDVHHGFSEGFDSIRKDLESKLLAIHRSSQTKPIFICGHSLGGALAVLCACFIRSHRQLWRHPVILYTFAQPRVGTLAFAQHYWSQRALAGGILPQFRPPPFIYYRTHDPYDVVTMVPNKFLADAIAGRVTYEGGRVAAALEAFTRKMALEPFSAAAHKVRWALFDAAMEVGGPWLQKQLQALCPRDLDYRHFGVSVLAVQDENGHPYLIEDPECSREIEHESVPRIQTVWKPQSDDTIGKRLWDHVLSIGTYHVMGNYLAHSAHSFEHRFEAYSKYQDTYPPLARGVRIPAHEVQLLHRFFHNHRPMLHHHFHGAVHD